jgi:general secretion pathway protein E
MNVPQMTNQKPDLDARQLQLVQDGIMQGSSWAQIAQEIGYSSELELLKEVAELLDMELIDLPNSEVDEALLEEFPIRLIHRYSVFPVRREDSQLVVAISNPFDLQMIDAVEAEAGESILLVLAPKEELGRIIKSRLGVGAETIEGLLAQDDSGNEVEMLEEVEWDRSEASEMAQEASVVRLVNEILVEAIESRTSDIHIESQANGLKIRYRIDGVLQTQPTPPEINRFQSAIISRLKIMSKMNIAEKRVPQDGRIKLRVAGREVDIRVSMIPMLHGEGIVMRILDKDKMNFSLRGIGMDEDIYQRFQKLIKLPHGIILVTGPTGSGKTTTLYSALNEIKDEATKIITTEDPIEYQLDGINQIQVHTKVGMTFAASLRAILRHDPDVVLVGEIRDFETAENAIQASLTGHVVFSTLHTNDAAGAYMRLGDMGVEPFLIGTTVEGVMAQRLVRKLCDDCKQEDNPPREELPDDFPYDELMGQENPIYKAVGCRTCRNTGYTGRMGLYELMVCTESVRELAIEKATTSVIKKEAMKSGMRTLRQDGWRKVGWGVTSVDEILRVTKADF